MGKLDITLLNIWPDDDDDAGDKENVGDSYSIPGLGRSPGGGNGNLLHYFCLGNSMDRRI